MKNHCDMVLKHSLGYGNESFYLLYDRPDPTTGGLGRKKAGLPIGSPTSSDSTGVVRHRRTGAKPLHFSL